VQSTSNPAANAGCRLAWKAAVLKNSSGMEQDRFADKLSGLVEALAQLDELGRLPAAAGREPESEALAVALLDIGKSAERLATELIPAVLSASSEQLPDLLHACREELRHVCYHVADSAYLRVVMPSS
jgi:hypothetical protein